MNKNAHEKREFGARSSRLNYNMKRSTAESDIQNSKEILLPAKYSKIECQHLRSCRVICDEGYQFPKQRANAIPSELDCVPIVKLPGPNYEKMDKLGGYYKLHATLLTWEEARNECIREGAHLNIINSQAEAEELKKIFESHPTISDVSWVNNQAFIGVNDLAEEGNFVTIFGQPLRVTGFTRWAKNEPNNYKSKEHCVAVNREGTLNDVPCGIKLPFFCEQEI